mgnify:CR=1 FL=1
MIVKGGCDTIRQRDLTISFSTVTLVSPSNDEVIAIPPASGTQAVVLTWEAVTDLSTPVTYTVEVWEDAPLTTNGGGGGGGCFTSTPPSSEGKGPLFIFAIITDLILCSQIHPRRNHL